VFVLILVRVHSCAEPDEVVHSFLVLDAEVMGAMDFSGEGSIAFISQCPVDDHGVVLVRLEEPFLMRGERSPILLIGPSVEGTGVQVTVEAHTGLQIWVGPLDAVMDERS
jgi:hypothetical protein